MKNQDKLLEVLSLEKLDRNLFRAESMDMGSDRVFGGQVLAQAASAAMESVPIERSLHSLHGYFILPGNKNKPIIYRVTETRDGGSFATRRVTGIQDGKDIFILASSFQLKQDGLNHQITMPEVPKPDGLASDYEIAQHFKELVPDYLSRMLKEKPIDFKPVEMPDLLTPIKNSPFQHVWFKYKGVLNDEPRMHQKILAYASDYNLLITALRPHEVTVKDVQLASLDHAMWFHRDFRADEWLLYALDSPSASNARGFTRGNIFDLQGRLVASVVQEGLLRLKRK